MMSSPFPTLAICLSYAYFSKVLGPKLMENRKPFDLRGVLITYNFLQTLFSTWIFYEVRFSYVSLSTPELRLPLAGLAHLTHDSKIHK